MAEPCRPTARTSESADNMARREELRSRASMVNSLKRRWSGSLNGESHSQRAVRR